MTPLEVQDIWPNDSFGWDEFLKYVSPDPYEDDAWFTVAVGIEGEKGGTDFQVHVATPASIGRIKQSLGRFQGLIVDEFTPANVEQAIRTAVREASGLTFYDGLDRLRQLMFWEYEGMAGTTRPRRQRN